MVRAIIPAGRMQRCCFSLVLLWYAQQTIRSIRDNLRLLRIPHDLPKELTRLSNTRSTTLSMLYRALRYTFFSQIIASMEYLIALVKPVLAMRIARLLVWSKSNAVPNQSYGSHPRQTMDLYGVETPTRSSSHKDVILFIHGGAWSFGHKWQYGVVGEYLATKGFLVGVVNYRTYPTGAVQDQVDDITQAVRGSIIPRPLPSRS
jgi:hypothetical protein